MRRRNTLSIAIAAVLGALAVAALPALAGTKDDHRRGHDRAAERQHHGVLDRDDDAGTIAAFDAGSGKLTVALGDGGSVTGQVTARTEIRCEGPDEDGAVPSRDSGPGSRDDEEDGDDRACSAAELTVGATVHEADLELEHGSARFEQIELAHTG